MPLPEDIIVARAQGAQIQQSYNPGVLKFGVVGRSRGKNTSSTITITRSSTGNQDYIRTATGVYATSPIRSIVKAVDLDTGDGEEYYPNIHFLVIKQSDSSILDPRNLGVNDNPANLRIDWASAPPLVPPVLAAELVSSTTGGFDSTTTVYYAVSVVDHNAAESDPGALTKVEMSDPSPDYWNVNLSWNMVEYSTGYKVYRGTQADGSDLLCIATIAGKTVTTLLDDNITASGSPQTVNLTRSKPKNSDTYDLYYYYGLITKMILKEFTSPADAKEEHGIGSELSNVCNIMMAPIFNNAPVVVTVVPESETYNGYLAAAQKFQEQHVNFILALYAGTENLSSLITAFQPFYNLCASLSDETYGQKECYAVFALPIKTAEWNVNDALTFTTAYQSTATKGKRGHLVVPDKFDVSVSVWELPSGQSQENYSLLDPTGVDITPLVFAGATLARYCGLRDPSEPLTEKDVVGFTFNKGNFTTGQIRALRTAGCLVVENISGIAVVSQSINMSQPILGIEDGEVSVAVTEDWMREDLRTKLRKWRGKKQLDEIIKAAEASIIDALRQYKDNYRIRYFDLKSVKVYSDPAQKDRILGTFKYTPVYPINKVFVTYDYVFVTGI